MIELQFVDLGKFAYGVVYYDEPLDEYGRKIYGDKFLIFAPLLDAPMRDFDDILRMPHRFSSRISAGWTRIRRVMPLRLEVIGKVEPEALPEINPLMRGFYEPGIEPLVISNSAGGSSVYAKTMTKAHALASKDGFPSNWYLAEMILNDEYPWSATNFFSLPVPIDFHPLECEREMRASLGLSFDFARHEALVRKHLEEKRANMARDYRPGYFEARFEEYKRHILERMGISQP